MSETWKTYFNGEKWGNHEIHERGSEKKGTKLCKTISAETAGQKNGYYLSWKTG
mgnify:CR=1 FL=1